MTVAASVDDVWGSVGREVGGRIAGGVGRCREEGEVIVADHADRPRQVADVAVAASVDHVMRAVDRHEVRGRIACRPRRMRVVGEVIVTDHSRGPVEAVYVPVRSAVHGVL